MTIKTSQFVKTLLIFFTGLAAFTNLPEEKPMFFSSYRPYFTDTDLVRIAKSHRWSPTFQSEQIESEKANFGRALFFDARLSQESSISCATCHQPQRSFTDGKKVPQGVHERKGLRNTPSLVNMSASQWFFWDGRADSLAMQALGPLESDFEHGSNRAHIAKIIVKYYQPVYESIYGPIPDLLLQWLKNRSETELLELKFPFCRDLNCMDLSDSSASYIIATLGSSQLQKQIINAAASSKKSPQDYLKSLLSTEIQSLPPPNIPKATLEELNRLFFHVGDSLAHYQRAIVAKNAPFDLFLDRLSRAEGNLKQAFSPEFSKNSWQGFKLFVQLGCQNCHSGPVFTDHQFHNIGLPPIEPFSEKLSKKFPSDLGRIVGLKKRDASEFKCELQNHARSSSETCLEAKYLKRQDFEQVGAFKTPTLRNLIDTAPYMHDGRFEELEDVIKHYENPLPDAMVGHRDESIATFPLSELERKQLVTFLKALSGPVEELTQN